MAMFEGIQKKGEKRRRAIMTVAANGKWGNK